MHVNHALSFAVTACLATRVLADFYIYNMEMTQCLGGNGLLPFCSTSYFHGTMVSEDFEAKVNKKAGLCANFETDQLKNVALAVDQTKMSYEQNYGTEDDAKFCGWSEVHSKVQGQIAWGDEPLAKLWIYADGGGDDEGEPVATCTPFGDKQKEILSQKKNTVACLAGASLTKAYLAAYFCESGCGGKSKWGIEGLDPENDKRRRRGRLIRS